MIRAGIVAVAVLVAVAPGTAADASPLQLFGFGGRSPGMAATGVAAADDYDCVYLNPAGLSDLRRKRLSVGFLAGGFDLEGIDRPAPPARGVILGGALPIPLGGVMKDRVGLALGFYVPTNVLNRARAPAPGTPYYALLESRAQVVGLQVGLGVRVTKKISAGAGFLALAALRGRIEVSADNAGRFTTTSEQQLITHFAPILGARYRLSRDLDLGATLRFPSRSAYDIAVTNSLGEVLPLTLPELRVAGVAQYDPLTVAVEGAWRPRRDLLVTGQVAWERWSAFPLPTENPVASMPPQPAPGFSDTIVPRAAVEWTGGHDSLRIAARAGYFFALSPAPDDSAFRDNDRHVFSAGIGLLDPSAEVPLHVDAWMQAHVLWPRGEQEGTILVGGLVLGVDL